MIKKMLLTSVLCMSVLNHSVFSGDAVILTVGRSSTDDALVSYCNGSSIPVSEFIQCTRTQKEYHMYNIGVMALVPTSLQDQMFDRCGNSSGNQILRFGCLRKFIDEKLQKGELEIDK